MSSNSQLPTRLKALRRMKEETEALAVQSNTAVEQNSGKWKDGRGRQRKKGQGQNAKSQIETRQSVTSLKGSCVREVEKHIFCHSWLILKAHTWTVKVLFFFNKKSKAVIYLFILAF